MRWNRHQLFVIQQPLLCVCLSISVVSLIWCCLSFTSTQISSTMAISATITSTCAKKSRSRYRLCVPPCRRNSITVVDTHSLCIVCLRAEHAESALGGADFPLCEAFVTAYACSQRAFFEESFHLRSSRCRPCSFFHPERGLEAPPVFLQGGGRGGRQ